MTDFNRGEVKNRIVDIVNNVQGLKVTELVVKLMEVLREENLEYVLHEHSVTILVDELVKEGELVEVEYILPGMLYRIKSFLLPANTQVVLAPTVQFKVKFGKQEILHDECDHKLVEGLIKEEKEKP